LAKETLEITFCRCCSFDSTVELAFRQKNRCASNSFRSKFSGGICAGVGTASSFAFFFFVRYRSANLVFSARVCLNLVERFEGEALIMVDSISACDVVVVDVSAI
jgi:hypothetical protein